MPRSLTASVELRGRPAPEPTPYADDDEVRPTRARAYVNLGDPLPTTLPAAEAELGQLDGDILAIDVQLERHQGSTKPGHVDWEQRARFSRQIKVARRARVQARYDELRAAAQQGRGHTFEHAFLEAAKHVLTTEQYAAVVAEVIRTVPHLVP